MRNSLDEAIGVSPVSTVDVDAVVAKGRRRVLRRRFAFAGAGTAVTGVVAALALATFGPPAPVSPPHRQIGSGPGPAADGSAPVRDGETPEQTEQRLAAALVDGLTAALPGVRISDGPTGQPGVVLYHDPGASLSRYDSDIVITTAAREGEIFFESWPGGVTPVADQEGGRPSGRGGDGPSGQPALPVAVTWIESCTDVPAPYEDCEASVGPDGQTIVVLSARIREGAQDETGAGGPDAAPVDGSAPGEVAFHYAFVTWTNAKVQVTVASDTKRGEPDAVPQPPLLTRQQLVAVAIDPDLTVTA
jgi:hypothetical protein